MHFNPNDVEAHFNLGAALHQQGQIPQAYLSIAGNLGTLGSGMQDGSYYVAASIPNLTPVDIVVGSYTPRQLRRFRNPNGCPGSVDSDNSSCGQHRDHPFRCAGCRRRNGDVHAERYGRWIRIRGPFVRRAALTAIALRRPRLYPRVRGAVSATGPSGYSPLHKPPFAAQLGQLPRHERY